MSFEPATVPIYTPLDAASNTVRLLKLQKDQSGNITAQLQPFSLDSPLCPKFTTLSYVWGVEKCLRPIVLNGHGFPVLKNLGQILNIICDKEELRDDLWWIDCICINQNQGAEDERNSQVHMMRKIYETSTKTVGWLGQGIEDGEDAINFLHILRKHRNRLRYQEALILGKELDDRNQWAALEKLLLRPWWTRVWTLQEYIVAKDFIFYCGGQSINREHIKVAIHAIYYCRKIYRTLISDRAFEAAWGRRRLYTWYQAKNPMQLVGLMAYIGGYDSTDARDRVYSVLGLAQDRILADPPRYQDDIQTVYTDLVRSFMHHHNSLDIICLGDQFHYRSLIFDHGQHRLPWPSWLPDWRVAVRPAVVPVMASQSAGLEIGNFRPPRMLKVHASLYRASGGPRNVLRAVISDDLHSLKCQGIKLDLVDGLGGSKVSEDEVSVYVDSTSPANLPRAVRGSHIISSQNIAEEHHISQIVKKLTLCLLLGRKDRYLGFEAPSGHFSEDFLALLSIAHKTPATVHPLFRDWFQRNRSLRFQGFSLEEICAESTVSRKSTLPDLNDITDHSSFLSRFKDTTEHMNRRLITTNSGNIGMTSYRVQKSDQIWILLGCSVPLILRKYDGRDGHEFVGEYYLDGYMNGEAMEELTRGIHVVEDVSLV